MRIASKIAIPATSKTDLVRMRLVEMVNVGVTRKLTLLSAPEGDGKTTLLGHWAAQTPLKIAWLTLDRLDNDPRYFLEDLIAALRGIHKQVGQDIFEILKSPERPPVEKILRQITDLLGMVLQDFVLVLDDFQHLKTKPVFNMLTFFIDHMPPQMHLVIAGEKDPLLSLSKLRSDKQLMEIRSPHMGFTTDEAQAYYNETLTLKQAYGDISALITLAEARAYIIKYLGLMLSRAEDPKKLLNELEQQEDNHFDAILTTLIKGLPEAQQQWLTRIAITALIPETLAAQLSGSSQAFQQLRELSEQGYFFQPATENTPWLRWHPFVLNRLADQLQTAQPEVWAEQHLKAYHWFREAEIVEYIYDHALAAGQLNLAAEIIEHNAQKLLADGKLFTVESWIARLPGDMIQKRPMLSICCAWILIITQRFDQIHNYLGFALAAREAAVDPAQVDEDVAAIQGYLKNMSAK